MNKRMELAQAKMKTINQPQLGKHQVAKPTNSIREVVAQK